MSKKTLPSIPVLEYIPSAEMSLYPRKIIVPGYTITALGEWQKLNLSEPASCVTTSEPTANGLVYTTKITGVIFDEENSELQHRLQTAFHCYRLTDVYASQYLVGIDKKPMPEISFAPTNEASPAGMRAVPFEITWISTLPPIGLVAL